MVYQIKKTKYCTVSQYRELHRSVFVFYYRVLSMVNRYCNRTRNKKVAAEEKGKGGRGATGLFDCYSIIAHRKLIFASLLVEELLSVYLRRKQFREQS